jgi:hypothetical protein
VSPYGRLLAQVAQVAWNDAQACLPDPYGWPALPEPTSEQKAEYERLRVLSARLAYRAREHGVVDQGLDALFRP